MTMDDFEGITRIPKLFRPPSSTPSGETVQGDQGAVEDVIMEEDAGHATTDLKNESREELGVLEVENNGLADLHDEAAGEAADRATDQAAGEEGGIDDWEVSWNVEEGDEAGRGDGDGQEGGDRNRRQYGTAEDSAGFVPIPKLFRPPPSSHESESDTQLDIDIGEHNLATVDRLVNRFGSAVQSALGATFAYIDAEEAQRARLMANVIAHAVTVIQTAEYSIKATEEMARSFKDCHDLKQKVVKLTEELAIEKVDAEKLRFLEGSGLLEYRRNLVHDAALTGRLQARSYELEARVRELEEAAEEYHTRKLALIGKLGFFQSTANQTAAERDRVLREMTELRRRLAMAEKEITLLELEREFANVQLNQYLTVDPELQVLPTIQRFRQNEQLHQLMRRRGVSLSLADDEEEEETEEQSEAEESEEQEEELKYHYSMIDPTLPFGVLGWTEPRESAVEYEGEGEEAAEEREEAEEAEEAEGAEEEEVKLQNSKRAHSNSPSALSPRSKKSKPTPDDLHSQKNSSRRRSSMGSTHTSNQMDRQISGNQSTSHSQRPTPSGDSSGAPALSRGSQRSTTGSAIDPREPSRLIRRPFGVVVNSTAQQSSRPLRSSPASYPPTGLFTSRVNAILGIVSIEKSPVGSGVSLQVKKSNLAMTSKPAEEGRVNLVDYSSSPEPVAVQGTEQQAATSTTPGLPIAGSGATAEVSHGSNSEAKLFMADPQDNASFLGGMEMDPVSVDNSPAHSRSATPSSQESPPQRFLDQPDPSLHFPNFHRVSKFSGHRLAQDGAKHRVSKFSGHQVNAKRRVSEFSSPSSSHLKSSDSSTPADHPKSSGSSTSTDHLKSSGRSTSAGYLKSSVPVVRKAPPKVRFEIPTSPSVPERLISSQPHRFLDYDDISPSHSPANADVERALPTPPNASRSNGLTRTEKGDPPKDPTIGRSNHRNIKKGDGKGQSPILVWIPSAEALQTAKKDKDVRTAVRQGLSRSLLDLLHRCLQTGGKTIRRSNPSANSGLELRVCVNSQLKNKGLGACATTEFGRMHRCKRCIGENVPCLYLISEYFGYVMPPIPSDPRERDIGVEYQELAPGIGERDDGRENRLLYETEDEDEGEVEGEESEEEEEGEEEDELVAKSGSRGR